MKQQKAPRGVYFMANNRVFDHVIAFLRSFRTYNPTIPLCLIPFNNDFDRIAALKDAYNFSIFDDQSLLDSCDAISVELHGHVVGAYRKLVAWEGLFDTFAYIDVDTVVLDSVDFAFEQLRFAHYLGSQSNAEPLRRWVWKDNIHETHLLTPPQIAYSTNTGFYVSVRGMLPMKHILAKLDSALELKDSMVLHCMEQPFLNYLVVTSGFTYTSLLMLRERGIAKDAKLEWWGGAPGAKVEGGKLYPPIDWPIFLVHWAGVWQDCHESGSALPYLELWNYYRRPDLPVDVIAA